MMHEKRLLSRLRPRRDTEENVPIHQSQRHVDRHRKVLTTLATIVILSVATIWRLDNVLEISGVKSVVSKEGSLLSSESTFAPNANNNLWIYVESWHEGMAGWRPSLSQVLLLSKTFNATLVEPTIARSRLQRCAKDNTEKPPLQLSDILNRSRITAYHPKFATCQEYQQQLQKATTILYFDVCWDKNEKCKNGVATDHSKQTSDKMMEALETAANAERNTMIVLRFHDLWQNSMSNLRISSLTGDNNILAAAKQVATNHLHFRDSLYDMLDSELRKQQGLSLSVQSTFSVIHWRAENVKKATYLECANGIVKARQSMLGAVEPQPNATTRSHPFFVMSSLSMDDKNSWNGARINAMNTTALQALSLLRDAGFYKLDTLFDNNNDLDSMYYVAMDLILASKASMFATCTERCHWPKHHYCKKCNWIGNFAHLALEVRGDDKANSLPCWPQSAGQVEAIAKIPKEHV